MNARVLGVVLAGGRSSRFGSDKALAMLEGRPLIAHAVMSLASHVEAVAVAGLQFDPWPMIEDRPRPGLGPLGGIAGALHYASENSYDAVLTVPCDTPGLGTEPFEALLRDGGPAFVEELPVCGLWPASLADALDRHLSSASDRSMRAWAAAVGARAVRAGAPITNVNTLADLAALD